MNIHHFLDDIHGGFRQGFWIVRLDCWICQPERHIGIRTSTAATWFTLKSIWDGHKSPKKFCRVWQAKNFSKWRSLIVVISPAWKRIWDSPLYWKGMKERLFFQDSYSHLWMVASLVLVDSRVSEVGVVLSGHHGLDLSSQGDTFRCGGCWQAMLAKLYRSRCPQVYHPPTPWNRGFSGCRFSECSWVNVKEIGIELNNVPWKSIFCWTLDFENSKEFLRDKWYDPFRFTTFCMSKTIHGRGKWVPSRRSFPVQWALPWLWDTGKHFPPLLWEDHSTWVKFVSLVSFTFVCKGYLVPGGTPQFW